MHVRMHPHLQRKAYNVPLILFALGVAIILPDRTQGQSSERRRQAYLADIIRLQEHPASVDSFVNQRDKTWLDWQHRTGELPPDFDALPSMPFLPDLMLIDEGGANLPVKTAAQWKEQREYFKDQVKRLFSGTFPPPPEHLRAVVLDEHREDGVNVQLIELRFGEDPRARLTLELFTPLGEGPFPVFMTQWNHRGWAQIAVRRGYMALVYAGADVKDDTRDYLALYPDYDWTTLMTRAWGAHRAVDYLYTLPHVDRSKIAITGHSRNGKQSLLAAAFDARITAVISSSGGTAGEFPYRYTDERFANESIEYLFSRRTHWGHPRIRFYVGREHKLPIDQTALMALVAPNALLLSSSIREAGGGDPWAIEQAYNSLLPVYIFHNAAQKLGVRLRDGQHAIEARDLESYLDWLDIQFQRKNLPWKNTFYYNYSFAKWKSLSGEKVDVEALPEQPADLLTAASGKKIKKAAEWDEKKRAIQKDIHWIMGTAPAAVEASPVSALTDKEDYLERFMNRPRVRNGKKLNIAPYFAMGDYLHGSLYYPLDSSGAMATGDNGRLPVVIFLHKFSNTGFDSHLSRLFENILAKGVGVFAFDLIGYGTRIEEGTLFYERYPQWSKLGKMVSDTRAAVTALQSLDFVDDENIFVSGYSLGGTVGLFTAALDERLAGAAVSCAFTPWRDPGNQNQEGLKAYSELFGLLPRLGFFEGNENKVPVDFQGMLSAIAPRPLLVIAPELDRHANASKINGAMEQVRDVYSLLKATDSLKYLTPREFNQLTPAQESDIANWLEAVIQGTGAR